MKSKKLLSILLTVCMILSCISPAFAIQAGEAAYGGTTAVQEEAEPVTPSEQPEDAASDVSGEPVLPTLRNEQVTQTGTTVQSGESQAAVSTTGNASAVYEGTWEITPADGSLDMASLPVSQLPACVAELREAAEIYDKSDRVSAFVLMEAEPLFSTMGVPSASATQQMEELQNMVIMNIEQQVLNGGQLQVDNQLTYLTNGFAITTEFGNLEQIAMMDGVKSVFLMPVYYPCAVDNTVSVSSYMPYTVSSGAMCGVPGTWDLDYTGAGMTIAILDTGLDLDHPSFAADPASPAWSQDTVAAMMAAYDLNFESAYPGVAASDVYYSAKVPFIFNYGSASLDVTHADGIGDHGTHVAGISAANDVPGSDVVGMAPDAQLVIMKVFNSTGSAYMADIVAALEDALAMGIDVVNMSLGSTAGFSSAADEWTDSVYANIAQTEMIVNISAGNDGPSSYGNLWGTDLNLTDAPDNASISSPSTYVNVNSIASVDNNSLLGNAIYVNGCPCMYNDAVDLGILMTDLFYQNEELEYVMIGGYGEAADFEGVDVAGKVAVVARGVTNFSSKLANAEAAGAIALIVTNNVEGSIATFGMAMTDADGILPDGVSGTVPAIMVSLATGEMLAAAETKVITVSPEQVVVADEAGGQVSSFSSWGVTPDLRLLPDMAGIGGNVYSCYDGGIYGYMSGTSMSSPQVSGISALVMQYLKAEYVGDSDIADALMMSTAVPAISQISGVEFSPRQQGSGLVNAYNAVTSDAYITVNGGKPKAELGDDPYKTGSYTFTFTVNNFSAEEKSYTLSGSLLTEAVDATYGFLGLYFMAGYDCALDGTVTFDVGSTVTVPANSSVNVTATVTLSADGMAWLDSYFPNGGYVEGYVYLDSADGVDLSLPYLGFYGDWTDADLFDTAFWYDNSFWNLPPANGLSDGNEYFHVVWTDLGGSQWVLGFNPYTGALADDYGNVIYNSANNVVSPNGDGVLDGFEEIYLSLMRNAKELWFTYTDAETGVEYYGRDSDGGDNYAVNVSKTMFYGGYNSVVPFIHSWYWWDCYDFTDADGNVLPSGTTMNVTVSAKLDYEDAPVETISFPVTVDTVAPELVGTKSFAKDDRNYIQIEVREDVSMAYAALLSPNGSTVLGGTDQFFYDYEAGTYTAILDITGYGTELMVAVCDFGCNEGYFSITFTGDANLPEIDTDALYGYRVYDAGIYDDSLYGWVTIDKETGVVSQITNDMYEYYALTAAEYIDGYIFAVDAGYNLIIVQPGTFFRTKTICNLGFNVMDMTWDKTTDTMYLVGIGIDEWGYEIGYFCALDILTGELDYICTYDSEYSMPYTIACTDDGVIYAVQSFNNQLFTVDKETGDMINVTDADGNDVRLWSASGNYIDPCYNQSMTYSSEDGCIYWAFFDYNYDSELFKIIPATETEAVSYSSVESPVDVEIVGLLTLDEDEDYSIPVSTELHSLLLSEENVSMAKGSELELTVDCLPWNYEITETVTWTSSNESVATVTNGVITAVSCGQATITATCEGVEATCNVTVLDPSGTVYGYNYYTTSGWGDWFSIDLASVEYESTFAAEVDFITADYNGHHGLIYGYDENKNFYSCDPVTGSCKLLGKGAIVPFDMAYDYSTGFMYAVDPNSYTLYQVNLNTGEQVPVGMFLDEYYSTPILITLACSTDGQLYAVDYMGSLYEIYPDQQMESWDGSTYIMCSAIMSGLPQCSILQSMCYEHSTGALVWPCADYSSLLYIDLEMGAYVNLGNPAGVGNQFEYVGMYSIPAELPELPYVAVESVAANDLAVFENNSKDISFSIYPLNATAQDIVWSSGNTSVATVSGNTVTGVSAGSTTLTGTLNDNGTEYTVTINVTVLPVADNLYAYLVADLATYGSYCWFEIDVTNPSEGSRFVADNFYTMYSAEYVDSTGLVYGYGYDDSDWSSNKQFMIFDPVNYTVVDMFDMGDGFPFVYDLAYDYTTGTMYALASYNDTSSDLYMVNMDSGDLILVQNLDSTYQSLVVDENGTIYGISDCVTEYDFWTWTTIVVSNSMLVELDPVAGTEEPLFELPVNSDMFASAAYDYDTGYIYWGRFLSTYESALTVIDPVNKVCHDLGTINASGAQITGMHFVCDQYPETPDELSNVTLTSSMETLSEGSTVELSALIQPAGCSVDVQWTSSDESVATVDENGVVTAVDSGVAYITVTVTDGTTTVSATCKVIVFGAADYLITYNRTDGGFTSVDRLAPDAVSALNEGEEYAAVRAMAVANDVIYGYDVDGKFFAIDDLDTFERDYLGAHNVALLESSYYEMQFDVRDMAWDPVNERMLVLGCHSMTDDWGYWYEAEGGCRLYEANLETGALTELTTLYYGDGETGYSNAYTIAVDGTGTIHTYSTYIDYFGTIDPSTGIVTESTTLQSLGIYGDSDGNPMAMVYDDLTGTIYILWTSNGSYYRLINFDPTTGHATLVGDEENGGKIGEVVYDDESYSYVSDVYAGLILNFGETETEPEPEEHEHEFVYTDNGNGTHNKSCSCGAVYAEVHNFINGVCICGAAAPQLPSYPVVPQPGITVPTEPEQPEQPPVTDDMPFTDVVVGDWFYGQVLYAYNNNLMNGTSEDTFAPYAETTRGMIVTILYRLEGEPAVNGSSDFTDVASGQWYSAAVAWAAENGIVTGYDDGTFGPLKTITREQLAAIMFRYAAYKGYDVSARADLSAYVDAASISAYAVDAMSWANAVGLINGRTATALVPQGSANRAEVATILMRFCENIAK